MTGHGVQALLRHVRCAASGQVGPDVGDGELLTRFLRCRDETAFAALVRRYGPMVLGVCRRVLQHRQDAEDAFQATFLVLVRKGASIAPPDLVGNWLYGVAYRTALEARRAAARRRIKELAMPRRDVPDGDLFGEQQALLLQELHGLPDKYRAAIVLCDLQGKSRKAAAAHIGCPVGTLAGRLTRGRRLLARRLRNRGVVVSAAGLACFLSTKPLSAAVSCALVEPVLQAATLGAAASAAAASALSPRVAALTERVVNVLFSARLKSVVAAIVMCCLVGAGTALGWPRSGQDPAPAAAEQRASAPPAAQPLPAPQDKKPQSRFTIGKETTHVTEPVDKQGYIDYVAALNKRLGQGVTPDKNCSAQLFLAHGPHPEGAKTMPPGFYEYLGIPEPPDKGDYFVGLGKHWLDEHKIWDVAKVQQLEDQKHRATQRLWTVQQYPELAGWLKVNEKPLAVVVEAVKLPHFYYPMVPWSTEKEPGGLVDCLIPQLYMCREFTTSLSMRALLRASEGRFDEAWQDLLACHRLGRHAARGGTLIEKLVGYSIEHVASQADTAFLESPKLDSKKVMQCLKDLQTLPPMPPMADTLDLGERFMSLDTVMMVDRHGFQYLDKMGMGNNPLDVQAKGLEKKTNWDAALRDGNRWFDRIVAAMRIAQRPEREKQLEQIEADLKKVQADLKDSDALAKLLKDSNATPEQRGKVFGDVIINMMLPSLRNVQRADDRNRQVRANAQVAFALVAFQRDHGAYPKKLDELAPKYVAAVPDDLFTGKALIYRPSENGFLLYSVGANGIDEQGRTSSDEPAGDDLVVRLPLPPLKK